MAGDRLGPIEIGQAARHPQHPVVAARRQPQPLCSALQQGAAGRVRRGHLVEQGAVTLVCDGQRYDLNEGDCVTFDADLPHHFENPGSDDASFLAVVSAGLRRS